MDRETLNDYLTVIESTGPLAAFDARSTIAKWMSLKQHRPKTDDSQQKGAEIYEPGIKNVLVPSPCRIQS